MDESSLVLDGNAAAGMLREVFVHDMTMAMTACAACGAVARLGGQPLYDYPDGPGAVLRCASCEAVLMVVVHATGRYRMAAPGLSWMEIEERQ
ncbi:MAG TPA: DUF6510 family protein [Terriglobales bacterium]|nr:DUF6510 family protein [Terriglobales bacterium]